MKIISASKSCCVMSRVKLILTTMDDGEDGDVVGDVHGNLHLHVTPTTVESGDPVVTLDCFPTLRAFSRCVSLHLVTTQLF